VWRSSGSLIVAIASATSSSSIRPVLPVLWRGQWGGEMWEWYEVGLGTDCDLAEGRLVNLWEPNDRADVKLKLTFVVF